MRKLLFIIIYLSFISPAFAGGNKAIENTLQKYIKGKDARIGVAVIINGKDTVSVNGNRDFPMMSVVKFPLALTVAHWIDTNGMSLNDTVTFNEKAMKEDTYSPMLKKYGKSRNAMTVRELLEWSLAESDNNAADILLHRVGGTSGVTSIMRQMGISDEIVIGASEEDMHRDPYLSYLQVRPYLKTIHSVKGMTLEAILVFLSKKAVSTNYATILNNPAKYSVNNNEELRIVYVACTRPKKLLWIAVPSDDIDCWRNKLF